jgi:hypothetical protein
MTKFKDGKKRSSGCGNVECFIKAVKNGDVLDALQALAVIIEAQSLKGPGDECVVVDGNNPQRMLLLHVPCGDHKEHYYRFDLTTALMIGAGLVVKKKHLKILLGGIGKVVNTCGRDHCIRPSHQEWISGKEERKVEERTHSKVTLRMVLNVHWSVTDVVRLPGRFAKWKNPNIMAFGGGDKSSGKEEVEDSIGNSGSEGD